jgi:precorrin-6x reductase
MLTTIVVGNRFTKRKRGFIFTPRGYNDWAVGEGAAPEAAPRDALPHGAAWVFSGTSDGNALARTLAETLPVVVSAATEHGGALAAGPGLTVWAGRQGIEARRQALVASGARVLVDATHPYATLMSEQLVGLARELDIPYLRYERTSDYAPADGVWRATPQLAAQTAIASGQRIFLATGSKDLATYLQAPGAGDKQWFLRLTADPELIERAVALGVPRERICAMQGPFSSAFNEALWRDWQIDCVVTKDSGGAGGYGAKVAAARALGIALVVQGRPVVEYPRVAGSTEQVFAALKECGIQ